MRRTWAAAVAATAVLSGVSTAQATVVLELERGTLIERSDRIVRATVGSARSGWNEDHTQIITLTELRVAEYWKGSGPATLTLRQLGGSVDGLSSRVAGDAQLEPGEEVVLFLKSGAGVVYLTALAQSAYHVTKGKDGTAMATRDLRELGYAVPGKEKMSLVEPKPELPEPLAGFRADVQKRVAR